MILLRVVAFINNMIFHKDTNTPFFLEKRLKIKGIFRILLSHLMEIGQYQE